MFRAKRTKTFITTSIALSLLAAAIVTNCLVFDKHMWYEQGKDLYSYANP